MAMTRGYPNLHPSAKSNAIDRFYAKEGNEKLCVIIGCRNNYVDDSLRCEEHKRKR